MTLLRGITFPWPTAPVPIYVFMAPGPNYFFTAPNDGITFSRPLTMELLFHGPPTSKITFSMPLVITIVGHVFFYSFKQNSIYSLFENSFQQNVLSYINRSIAVWIHWLFFLHDANWKLFLNRLEIYKHNNFCKNNVKQNIYFKWKTKHKTKRYC